MGLPGRTPEDLVMQLLILKMLYILFNTKGLSEYFYTNDLCVLVDVFLLEIVDLDEDSESVRNYFDSLSSSNPDNYSSGTHTSVCSIPSSLKRNCARCHINDHKLFVPWSPWLQTKKFAKSARRQNALSSVVSLESGVYTTVHPATDGSPRSMGCSAPRAQAVTVWPPSHLHRS